MPLGLTLGSLGRAMRQKRPSSLDILSSKRAPRDYYKGKNCKPTGFHTRKGKRFAIQWSRSSCSGLALQDRRSSYHGTSQPPKMASVKILLSRFSHGVH